MRCARCHRALALPAATVQTRRGSAAYGPVCADRMGLTTKAAPRLPARLRKLRPVAVDAAQMNLELEATL